MHSPGRHHEGPTTEIWGACQKLTSQADWQRRRNTRFTHLRSVTWNHHPNTYLLTEYAERAGWLGSRLATRMFELSKLGKLNTDTGLHDYTRYEIIGNEVIASIDTKVRPFDVLTGADKPLFRMSLHL